MTRRKRRARAFQFEVLETRTVMAAAITQMAWEGNQTTVYDGAWILGLAGFSGTAASQVDRASQLLGSIDNGFGIHVDRYLSKAGLFRIQTQGGVAYDDLAGALGTLDCFEYVEPDQVLSLNLIPNDTSFTSLWGLNNTGQNGGTVDADIDAPEAWDISTGSSSIVVGIVDTGIDYTHPDLVANVWTNPGEVAGDGIDNDGNGFIDDIHGWDFVNDDSDPIDDNGHGTHVAGTIGAVGNNGGGVVGVNWQVRLMGLKFLDETGHGSTSDAVDAMNYANMMRRDYGVNIRVTNHSWSGSGYSQSLYNAINDSRLLDMLFVAAASNGGADGIGDNNDTTDTYPANYNLDNVIAVAATNSNDQLAGFSNYGATTVDLGAPGVSIRSTLPNNNYGNYNGTSMATPHVVGVAALAWSVAPSATYQQIRDAIFAGVDPIPALAGITVTGGRLNALKTLEQLGLQVTSATPAPGSIVGSAPVDFTLDFSDAVNAGSVFAGAFSVNGVLANSVTVDDSDTVTFHYLASPVTGQGPQSYLLAANSITRASDNDGVGAYAASFYYDAVPMQIIAVTPALGSTAQTPITTVTLQFNEAYDPASVSIADLSLSQGNATGFTFLGPDRLRFDVAGIEAEGNLTIQMAAGALLDLFGNPSQAFSGSFAVDIGTLAFPAMSPILPLGPGAYEATRTAGIGVVGDLDNFTIALLAGQTISVILNPSAGLRGVLEARDGSSILIGSAVGSATGTHVLLNALPTGSGGTFTITVAGDAGTTGSYSVRVLLNGLAEVESQAGAANQTIGQAQSIDGMFTSIAIGLDVATILGQGDGYAGSLAFEAESNNTQATANAVDGTFVSSAASLYQLSIAGSISSASDVDWYAIGTLNSGDVLTVTQSGSPSSQGSMTNPQVDLYRGSAASPTLVTTNNDGGPGADALIWKFSITTTDTYYIRARNSASSTGTYRLAAWMEDTGAAPATGDLSSAETEANNAATTANNFASGWRRVNYASDVAGTVSTSDTDFFRYDFAAGDLVTVNASAAAGVETRVALLSAAGTVLAAEDGTSTGPGTSSPIYAYRIATGGTYYLRVQANSGSGSYVAQVRLSTMLPLPAVDYYSVTLAAGERISVAALVATAGTLNVELRDGADGVLASGTTGATNLTKEIAPFAAPAAGTYYLRVNASQGLDYRLVIVRGGAFDTETNDVAATTSLDGVQGTIGHLNPNRPEVLGNAVFTIDAGLSTVALGGTAISDFGSLPILEQSPGSLTTSIGGTLAVDFAAGTIAFVGGSAIDPALQPGVFLPNNLPADFAARLDLLPPNIIAQLALRNTLFDALSGALPLDGNGNFAAEGVRFKITSGVLDYVVPLVLPAGSYDLSGLSAGNESTDSAALAKLSDRWVLTIPVLAVGEFPEPTTGILLRAELTGQLVATLLLDPPIDPVDNYSVTLAAGETVHLETRTLLAAAGNLGPHGLDPRIVLFDPNGNQVALDDNSGGDGINALLGYTASVGGVYRVEVSAQGAGLGEYALLSSITVNQPPVASIAGPTFGVRGQPRTYTLAAADDAPGLFTFHIDWTGDNIADETVVGPSGTQVSHVFAQSGAFAVKVWATDGQGATGPVASLPVTITGWALQTDEVDPLKTNFVIGGTDGVDAFGFVPGLVFIQFLNNQYFPAPQIVFTNSFNGKLVAYGQGSDDLLFADVMSASVEFHGGGGNDVLVGGRGADWIDGGVGDDIILGGSLEADAGDVLLGGSGSDLIIGHLGGDTISGGSGQDLLIAGLLFFDDLPGAVYGIQAEWTSGRPYAERVANLLGPGAEDRFNGDTFLVPGATVLDEGAVDQLLGEADPDWLLYDFATDLAPDLEIGIETATDLG